MSAWVVNRKHIIYMVDCHRRIEANQQYDRRIVEPEKLAEYANMLWQENIKSVQHRYPDCVNKPENMPGPIGESFVILPEEFLKVSKPAPMSVADLAQLAKSIHCYEYQSCEHDEWNGSDAYLFCQMLRDDILRSLPGYDDAHWGGPLGE